MPKLRYTSEALDNIADIAAYIAIATDSETLGQRVVEELRGKCRKIAGLPGKLGRERFDLDLGLRSVAHKNYVIFFRYGDDILEVVAVLEGHRDLVSYFDDENS
ncbi:MAG: type II toxin-antitoxin system RelE/ParE family toxin [Mesorhizobium sp.]|nr:type II toxin-antitoxin system RelE/ParE family toxin [Mesorhizobium sp.]MBL8579513.1 type II toxin-antitoxin system RelE/ParE family toxin [Mesorhizobium sp.]